jgi:signal peptide peptidase SppA
MKNYEHIIRLLCDEPWAIIPAKLEAICEFINLKLSGANIEFQAFVPPQPSVLAPGQENGAAQNIAVLPIYGVIAHRANMLTNMSGGMSLQKFGNELSALVNDPDIGAILLDVDSPGGSVAGVEETGDLIAAAARQKPILAHANATAASAAYWLASQASECWVTPSGQVGSIGVMAAHQDTSVAQEKLGIKTTVISAGKYKAEGHDSQPLTETARDYMQERVDQYYTTFIQAVARGRHVPEKDVRAGFGQGRVVGAREALEMGMVDGVGTFDHVIDRLAQGKVKGSVKVRAEVNAAQIAAEQAIRDFWVKAQYE